ncbi:MAG: MATE family efflux transporter [Lachnospiraceae bacterium]|nr:MATE family efflux transporter [Candidatus Fimimorpha excrementavium]
MNQKTSSTLLTEGPIWKKIIAFAIPLFLGNLFQQLYNTADSVIVGNFIGSDALAAVSSSGSLIFLLVGFFNGVSVGAGVVVARYYGARRIREVQKAIHTTIAFGLVAGVLLTIIGFVLAPQILVWMGTPSDVLPNSITYFRIYFLGSLAFVLYNIFVGILQSIGDSRHPLIYLIISSVVNVVLDLLFIAVFHYGVGSAALATIISQFISAGLCLRRLMKSPDDYRVSIRKIRFDFSMLRQVISNGLPAGLQNSIIALANVVVQSNINSFGKMAVAGCGAYSKIEGFGFLPITCFALALTTFISQNLGAKQYDRAKKGARFGILCSIVMAELVGICIFFLSPVFIAAFNNDPEVIAFGTRQAHTVTLFYFLLAFSHCIAGILRGAGKSTVPMFVMMICWCVIRVTYITIMVRVIPDISVIFWAYPLTWALSSIIFLIYFLKGNWMYGFEKKAIRDPKDP